MVIEWLTSHAHFIFKNLAICMVFFIVSWASNSYLEKHRSWKYIFIRSLCYITMLHVARSIL